MVLYHRTTHASADAVLAQGRFLSREARDPVYFSTHGAGQAAGYGPCVVVVNFPEDAPLTIDDEFPDGEQHYAIPAGDIDPAWITDHICD